MRTFFLLLFVVLLALGLTGAGCKKDDPVSGPTSERYSLISVNGDPLPAQVDSGSDWVEHVMSASIDLYSDRRLEMRFTWRRTTISTGATETESETTLGSYEITGSTIELDPDDLPDDYNIAGTISGNDIIFTEDGLTFVFRK